MTNHHRIKCILPHILIVLALALSGQAYSQAFNLALCSKFDKTIFLSSSLIFWENKLDRLFCQSVGLVLFELHCPRYPREAQLLMFFAKNVLYT
jgi:hypothetical protein